MKKSFSYSIAAFTHCYIALCRVEAPESSEAPESTQTPVPTQNVSVEFDTEQALTEEPAGEAQVSDDGTAIEYETTDGTNVEESFDLTAEITDTETDGEGNLTDITYDVSLDRQTENGTDTTVTENVDEVWAAEGSEEIKVELSVNGMEEDPNRVEHTYEGKTEYYYNEANKTEGETGKKYFTVETVKDAAETVVNKVVSLWTSFLGVFKVTNDALEKQDDMSTAATLDEAVNSAADVTSVQTLRDSGIDTISISVDKDVTFEMDITEGADTGMGDRVVVRRDESTLTITDEENVQLSFELDGLKAEAESSVHINYSEGVVTIYFDSAEVFKVEVTEAVKANKEITFRLENGVLKLFDKSGRLIQEIEM